MRRCVTGIAAAGMVVLTGVGVGCDCGCGEAAPVTAAAARRMIAEARAVVPEISPRQAHAEMQSNREAFLLNVCERFEYDKRHIPGSVLIPRGLLEWKIAKNDLFVAINKGRIPRQDQPILVYCRSGRRSVLAGKTLKELGYTNVRSIAGGLRAWAEARLPLEGKAAPAPH